MNISLTMYVDNNCNMRCSGGCAYCTAASAMNYGLGANKVHLVDDLKMVEDYNHSHWRRDWDKVFTTLEGMRQFKHEMTKDEGKRFLHVDFWGSDPVTNFSSMKEAYSKMREFCDKHGWRLTFSSSTNGLPLSRTEILDWCEENGVHIQLSHDGVGQWIRTQDFDPVWDIPNMERAFKDGVINAVNCTLTFYNNDLRMNMRYWNKWLAHCWPDVYSKVNVCSKEDELKFRSLYVKLNHIYDGVYDLKNINKDGRFQDKKYEELRGKPLGNMNFINWTDNPYSGELHHKMAHCLDDYIHSYYNIAMVLRDPRSRNNPSWVPFTSYFKEQMGRWEKLASHDQKKGACRSYQRWRHGIGEPSGWSDETFVVDTMGNFSECNLISSNFQTENPGGVQPEHCSTCPYELQSECNKCGAVGFPDNCEYNYRWCQFLEEMVWLDEMTNGVRGK